jgi:hypothetical protein
MSEAERKAEFEIRPAQRTWVNTVGNILFAEKITKAEWDWYGRIAYLPEDRWQRAINSVFERTMAAKASEHLAKGKGWRR